MYWKVNMNTLFSRVFRILTAVLLIFAFTACSDDGPGDNSGTPGGTGKPGPASRGPALTHSLSNMIPGVTPPAFGQTPVTNHRGDRYFASVAGDPPAASTFRASITYTARIEVRRVDLRPLANLPADYFKVAGAATVSNSEGSAVVTAAFSKTGDPAGPQ